MKDDSFEGLFFIYIYVRIYKQLDAMLQNGILLTFSRLANCLFMFFWTCVWVSCAFLFPILLEAVPKSFPNQNLRTGEATRVCLPPHPATIPDMGLLFMGLNLHPPQYILYITLWSICFFSARLQPCRGVSYSHLLVCPSASFFYVCVESLLEFAG